MDLLATRYASPFLVLDEFIRLHQLHEFILETLKTIAEERINEKRWEYYLHRVHGMTFEEYVRRCEEPEEKQGMSHEQIGSVINDSKMLLEGFMPE